MWRASNGKAIGIRSVSCTKLLKEFANAAVYSWGPLLVTTHLHRPIKFNLSFFSFLDSEALPSHCFFASQRRGNVLAHPEGLP